MTRVAKKMPKRILGTVLLPAVMALVPAAANSAGGSLQQRRQSTQAEMASQPRAASESPTSLASPEEDYRLGPSDLIEIQIEDAPELSGVYRINSAGSFHMHFLGRIPALQKTPEELQQYIADRLRGDYLKDPRVTILVRQINSRSFFIQGSVRNPGVYQIEGRPSLLELITLAGGLTENHGSTAFVIRKVKPGGAAAKSETDTKTEPSIGAKPDGASRDTPDNPDSPGVKSDTHPEEDVEYRLIRVNISGLLKGNFDQNTFIEPRDIINIPPADVFFVAGEVKAPGSFPLKEGTTLRQAISLAQGTTFKASSGRGIIFREDASGKRQEINVDIGAVMSGKKEDVAILANDIIIVPNSRLKSVGGALLTAFGVNSARIPVRY